MYGILLFVMVLDWWLLGLGLGFWGVFLGVLGRMSRSLVK